VGQEHTGAVHAAACRRRHSWCGGISLIDYEQQEQDQQGFAA
jgi:hypothetical protein